MHVANRAVAILVFPTVLKTGFVADPRATGRRASAGRQQSTRRRTAGSSWGNGRRPRNPTHADDLAGQKLMKLFRFLPGRGTAGSWRHQGDTGTVAPRKPTSSWAPADRKALARSRLLNGKDLLRTSAATLGRFKTIRCGNAQGGEFGPQKSSSGLIGRRSSRRAHPGAGSLRGPDAFVHQRDRAQPLAGRGKDCVEHRRGRDGHGRLSDAAPEAAGRHDDDLDRRHLTDTQGIVGVEIGARWRRS
jgi:hypothetical protein